MTERPNLFRYATSELSQDAFLCWLLSWADKAHANSEHGLHKAGLCLLNALICLHNEDPVICENIVVHKQMRHIDIVVEIGVSRVLLIEDKTDTVDHSNQLERYIHSIKSEFPNRKVLPVFLKTGDQGNYKAALKAGFKLFLRRDILSLLHKVDERANQDSIFADFLNHMESREKATQSYETSPPSQWGAYAWQGFFMALQERFADIDWGYVPSPSGGFMGAWWHYGEGWGAWETYLQIEEQKLVMKMGYWAEKLDAATRASIRNQWFDILLRAGEVAQIEIKRPPRVGNGASMTAALVGPPGEWIKLNADGQLDLQATTAFLVKATALLDEARRIGKHMLPVSMSKVEASESP